MIGIGAGSAGEGFSGGGVGMRRPERFEGQLAQGWVEQTEEERALQNALPKLRRNRNHIHNQRLFACFRRPLRKTYGSSEQAGQLDGSPLQTALAASMRRAAPVTAGASMAQIDGFFDFCEPVPLRRSLSGTAGSYVVSAAYGSSSAAGRRSTCCADAEDEEALLPE